MSKHRKKRSQMCGDVVQHSAEWAVSKELSKVNERLTIMCAASNLIWAVAVLVLVFIR